MTRPDPNLQIIGANGVAIPEGTHGDAGFRTYEVYQRERVGQSTAKIKPAQLVSRSFADNPYPLLQILREHYPCYRDWLNNCFWITRYNDVTSVFTDEANFATRPKARYLGLAGQGRDCGDALPVLTAFANALDGNAERLAREAAEGIATQGEADLAIDFVARFAMQLWLAALAVPRADAGIVAESLWRLRQGLTWAPQAQQAGRRAAAELVAYFQPLLERRRQTPGTDLVSAVANLALDGDATQGEDLVATLIEMDFATLHGGLANLWCLLLTHPQEFAKVREDGRFIKLAVLEAFRHSTPVLSAQRFARHEVERFGRLLPKGALALCSAAAANRDARIFRDPERFIVGRTDICHREARGQYRADGLAMGVTPGLGPPTHHPAVPEDRPRSRYALTRDTLVTASKALLETLPDLRLVEGAQPHPTCRRLGDMHACWHLPVRFGVRRGGGGRSS